jgi:hypothetical protein
VLQDFENVATCDLEAILLKGNLQSQQASAGGD